MCALQASDPSQAGPYTLVDRLGSGGMGQVYLGVSAAAERVAVKVLHAHLVSQPGYIERFEREALADALTAENSRREARETELDEARTKAETASSAKGEFLAVISHEIRTPMNGVLGMLRVVRDTPLSPEQRSYLKTASDSAESLLLLLNDVLDFSKIEAGRIDLDQVKRRSLADGDARRAGVAGIAVAQVRAVDRLCEDPRQGRLAGSSWTGKQNGVTDLVRSEYGQELKDVKAEPFRNEYQPHDVSAQGTKLNSPSRSRLPPRFPRISGSFA